jgi:predicted nuclease of predicted toxin-antitoxin system
MKLPVDMNLSPRWVSLLTDAGFEARHWSTLGRSKAPDTEIMAFAKANGFVVLTHDLDFSTILTATHGEKPSVVQIRTEDVSLDVIGNSVIVALRQMTAELEEGALLSLDPNRSDCACCRCYPKSELKNHFPPAGLLRRK